MSRGACYKLLKSIDILNTNNERYLVISPISRLAINPLSGMGSMGSPLDGIVARGVH